MNGWAWFLVVATLVRIISIPTTIGPKDQGKTPPGNAAIVILLCIVELFAVLKLAGVLP